MIPDESFTSLIVSDHFLEPDDRENYLLLDYEAGPIALNDPTEGLFYQAWTLRYFPATDEFVIEAPNTPQTVIHTAPDVTEISLAFDQNGNPFVAYVEDGDAKFWWWDPSIPGYIVQSLPAGSLTPRCCTDDKREEAAQENTSDILLFYVLNGELYYRQERDRFTVQIAPVNVPSPFVHPQLGLPAVVKRVGMNKVNRLQLLCDLANPIDWCGYVNYGN